ncbi:type II toxin-antitoxin system HipA family toxin [Streptomyces griseoincarnatus]|uniref:type II toxin-antitoxin system HipA family toxin n=1 Tax=Promicromonospora sp. NPDC057138 TaxID=3346031 RepID=UPI0036443021
MGDLIVELYDVHIGTLVRTGASFDFVAERAAIEKFGLDSTVLSLAVPLAVVPARARRDRRQNFFRELLPEGRMLSRLAQNAGVAEHDVVGMLRQYGRDIAGALQIWDPKGPGEPKTPATEPLTPSGVADLLRNVTSFPLANKPLSGKTSLAGVQDKVVLARSAQGWAHVVDGYPSTHILKPESRDYPTIIYDEEYGSRFARALGLADFATHIEEFDGVPALVVERYDRMGTADGEPPSRIHQEDFNQVLGLRGDQKYQRIGGKASLARIARELTVTVGRESAVRLARMATLAAAIGNLDLHAKNVSLLHSPDGSVELAPAYDVVPQVHLPNDGELALAVDRTYRHAAVTRAHLAAEFASWGLRDSNDVVEQTLTMVLETAHREEPDPRAHADLVRDITRFATNLLAGLPAGDGA